jgi:HD-GYP domain-containing protein (c-di-GMP phosphodiesterase class II)
VSSATGSDVRLAELVAALSLAIDLGYGQPMEHVMRSSRVALGLAERLGLDESERATVYYVGLLACVGCSADAHEQAHWFGDDIAFKASTYGVDMAGLSGMAWMMGRIGAGEPPLRRARTGLGFIGTGRTEAAEMAITHCVVAGSLAERLGLSGDVRLALEQAYERWDGQGQPAGLAGEEISIAIRLVKISRTAEAFHRSAGVGAAIAAVRKLGGKAYDPALVELLCDQAPALLDEVAATSSWDALIAAEPALGRALSDEELDGALEAIADWADLKSPYTLGHSRGVADLAAEAALRQGLPDADVVRVRRAGLIHDLGRLGVSNSIWDKRGQLSLAEWERVRLHPYLTERILASSAALVPLGAIAVDHHERLDGSGYPRGVSGDALSRPARILAAADVYHAVTEPRPHRPAHTADDAAAELRAEVRAGRLDADAVAAILAAAGHRVGRRREGPAGLTPREIEVLRLLARGLSNKQIAERLVISRKTASTHLEHIYSKLGVRSRAAAGMFAVQHGLLPEPVPAEHGQPVEQTAKIR